MIVFIHFLSLSLIPVWVGPTNVPPREVLDEQSSHDVPLCLKYRGVFGLVDPHLSLFLRHGSDTGPTTQSTSTIGINLDAQFGFTSRRIEYECAVTRRAIEVVR